MEKIECVNCRTELINKDDVFYHRQKSFQGPVIKIVLCRTCYYKMIGFDWSEKDENI